MHLTTLTLDQVRSYPHLDLSLQPGVTLIQGDNAQGKSNLLEAIYVLAVLRTPRAATDGELIAWDAPAPPVARIAGVAETQEGVVQVEIAIAARTDAQGRIVRGQSGAPLTGKRVRLNGIVRRSTDIIGAIGAVLFTTLDIEIVTGAPSTRRRFLDLAIAQSDHAYARALRQYERALTQRNALLKRIAQGEATADQLSPWNDAFATAGSVLVAGRALAVLELQERAPGYQARLSDPSGSHSESLALRYRPALGQAALPDLLSSATVESQLRAAMAAQRPREMAAGTSLVGPHRDDLEILLNDRPAAAYASRAQQRSVALSLRLAEADLLRFRQREEPILLLDDVFSELDPGRREAVAEALGRAEQVLVTSADPTPIAGILPPCVATYHLRNGAVSPI